MISELPTATDMSFPRPVHVDITANLLLNNFVNTLTILCFVPLPSILLINDSYNYYCFNTKNIQFI